MKYTEILKLKEMLEEAGIPFTFTDDSFGVKKKLDAEKPVVKAYYRFLYPAYQIRLGDLVDVIEHCYSYGNKRDLLEIMGGLTEEEMECDEGLGFLTAEEVFKRFKYCWEHQTSVYKGAKMKTLEKEIAEMAKAMGDFELEDTAKCDIELSEHLFAKGYRKQSDTVREFVEKVAQFASSAVQLLESKVYKEESRLVKAAYAMGKIDAIGDMMGEIKKLAKEYGVEVEE